MTETLDSRLQPIATELVRARLPLRLAEDEFRRKMILAALIEAGGNVTKAARILGVHRNTLMNAAPSERAIRMRERRAEREARRQTGVTR